MNFPGLFQGSPRAASKRARALMRKPARASLCVVICIAGVVHAQPLAAAAPNGAAQATAPDASEVHHLFQRADLGPSGRPVAIAINFAPTAWRVGSLDGPEATAAQLRSALAALQRIVLIGRCRGAEAALPDRPCSFRLGDPDFAGIVAPGAAGEVFGWVATARPATPGAAEAPAAAMLYFGLLSPMRYASPSDWGATIALRYEEAARTLIPAGFDTSGATVVLHNDRLPPLALRGTP